MDQTDIAILNLADDEMLSNHFAQKEPGGDVTIVITGKLLGIEEDNARISIEAVELEESEEEDAPLPSDTEPTGAEMVLGSA